MYVPISCQRDIAIGTYISKNEDVNGRTVYLGINNGVKYITRFGSERYLTNTEKRYKVRYYDSEAQRKVIQSML